LENELFRGLQRGEFMLHYQPIISLADERISGFEALIRWNHPVRGLLSPDEFIPFAEQIPFIIPLGFWIIEEAVKQLMEWERIFKSGSGIHIGVNLSASQFVSQELSSGISDIINKYGISTEKIAFEITETAFMSDMELANIQLLKLKSNNHIIYMDDFGTGYSSLSYLQHFPVDILKIDQSFVRWMHLDEQSEHIVRSVVALAHNLGMRVVAEGVDEDEHLPLLNELSCDFVQGFYFSPPMNAEDAKEFIIKYSGRKRS
jgi:EAL domain-containing protein (putative c-di-GMP-specific phosphodiesterase class I)